MTNVTPSRPVVKASRTEVPAELAAKCEAALLLARDLIEPCAALRAALADVGAAFTAAVGEDDGYTDAVIATKPVSTAYDAADVLSALLSPWTAVTPAKARRRLAS